MFSLNYLIYFLDFFEKTLSLSDNKSKLLKQNIYSLNYKKEEK